MLFNSWQYLIFFLVILILYFSLKQKWRIYLLLVSSYYFYMSWKWEFGLLMLGVSLLNFITGWYISRSEKEIKKKLWLSLALVISLGVLVYFKYANFFIDSFISLLVNFGFKPSIPLLNVILPVGISFFTFQALSYSIDVYRKKIEIEKNVVNFLTYVAFFPQLVAGPIERSTNLLRQFRENHKFDTTGLIEGGKIFMWGLFKKVVIADRLALYVDRVYSNPDVYSGSSLALATFFFTFQIYCDFSGYSDMAIGSARILGFKLMQNFNLPYLASSIADFWRRWHISLSSWFSDYVYIPLGGNRVKVGRWIFNIYVVFLLSGFWHGANWTFIIWGGLHASYYLIEHLGNLTLRAFSGEFIKRTKTYKVFKVISVFILVFFAWIFFRANSLNDALLICDKIFTSFNSQVYWGASFITTFLSISLILFLYIVQIFQYKGIASLYLSPSKLPRFIRWSIYLFLILAICIFGMSSNAFIYFQF